MFTIYCVELINKTFYNKKVLLLQYIYSKYLLDELAASVVQQRG